MYLLSRSFCPSPSSPPVPRNTSSSLYSNCKYFYHSTYTVKYEVFTEKQVGCFHFMTIGIKALKNIRKHVQIFQFKKPCFYVIKDLFKISVLHVYECLPACVCVDHVQVVSGEQSRLELELCVVLSHLVSAGN